MPLRALDFGPFFEEVHGHRPYRWQSELAERVCERGWPLALNMPTGTGKTAAIDIAVFHLAVAASRKPRDASMRIAYVIDRRLVVDGAFEHARRIATTLHDAAAGGRGGRSAAGMVARALLGLSYNRRPLDVVRMRGGMAGENDWARTPAQPTVLVSTIDQVGSRLLFRGYGVSNSMRPVHAGLLGSDALFILDEAHLSQPFADTLGKISGMSGKYAGMRPVKFVSMSATMPTGDAFPSGRRGDTVLRDGRLSGILAAHKYAKLKGPSGSVVDDLVGAARALSGPDHVRDVGIVVNRVSTAREVFSRLRGDMRNSPAGTCPRDVHLLTGRARPYDRDRLVRGFGIIGGRQQGAPSGEGGEDGGNRAGRNGDTRPVFYVATQCIEVGVDISFDALATQIAPIDSLVQRFGRLNRRGGNEEAHAVIVAGSKDIKEADPIYGGAMARTWKYLKSKAGSGVLDFGIRHFGAIPPDAVEGMRAPAPDSVTLLPEYTRLWAQTSPLPSPDPTPSLFLHGRQSGPPDVQVVWRADITGSMLRNGSGRQCLRTLTSPPSPLEAVSVPLWAAKKWLAGMPSPEVADVEGGIERTDNPRGDMRGQRPGAVRWRGRRSPDTGVIKPEDVAPGDTIVVPAEYGGCDEYGWDDGSRDPVTDIATEANLAYRRRISLRFDRNLLESYRMSIPRGTGTGRDGGPSIPGGNGDTWATVRSVLVEHTDLDSLEALLDDLLEIEGLPGIWKAALRVIKDDRIGMRVERATDGGEERIYGLESKGRVTRKQCERILEGGIMGGEGDGSEAATDGESGTGSGSGRIGLTEHCMGVRDIVKRFGSLVGLNDGLTCDVMAAGRLHDAGKAEARVQALLRGKDADEPLDGPPVAKSTVSISSSAEYGRRLRLARLPKGYRHERWSVSLARRHPLLESVHDRDLVLYLIGTHHGYGRPLFPVTGSDPDYAGGGLEFDGVSAKLDDSGSWIDPDWIGMCERLYERYGLWNVAYMESVLRLADHRQSEEEHEGN